MDLYALRSRTKPLVCKGSALAGRNQSDLTSQANGFLDQP